MRGDGGRKGGPGPAQRGEGEGGIRDSKSRLGPSPNTPRPLEHFRFVPLPPFLSLPLRSVLTPLYIYLRTFLSPLSCGSASIMARDASWSFSFMRMYASPIPGPITWGGGEGKEGRGVRIAHAGTNDLGMHEEWREGGRMRVYAPIRGESVCIGRIRGHSGRGVPSREELASGGGCPLI